ncbi:MAG: thiazole synthase [Planctomycetes bacterium]|nr:thiazole synthase [Planctomycetota bacterium]
MTSSKTAGTSQHSAATQTVGDDLPLVLGSYQFRSRLIVGTGKYRSFEEMKECHDASGADMITVAIRRVDFSAKKNLIHYIDRERYTILPNTAGCYNAEDAIRVARMARELLNTDLIKLEVLGDEKTLLPEPVETLKATEQLVSEGFTVLTYTSDDPILARRLADVGATSVMPAGSPIGSGQGVLNPNNIRIILETVKVPIIVDAGVGTASDVALAMELGVEGVLLNSGIALAKEPVAMARAMKLGVEAGRWAYLAGRIPRKLYGSASSPLEGVPISSN